MKVLCLLVVLCLALASATFSYGQYGNRLTGYRGYGTNVRYGGYGGYRRGGSYGGYRRGGSYGGYRGYR